jgi:single-stranded-DNA-specific exonuclease
MTKWKNRWQVAPRISEEANRELAEYPQTFRQILYNRGYSTQEEAQEYLNARPPEGTNPFNMLGIPKAVDRIEFAIEKQEPIAVYGDFDADGVTATALLYQTLHGLGAQVRGYIPHRIDEGYGLNIEALNSLYNEGRRLVITVDCGIRALGEAEHAREIGLDLIITDHHTPGEMLPYALAVINPKQPGETYPVKDLAGVGVAYKLACALIAQRREKGYEIPDNLSDDHLLDLVALGTVADLAPLVDENRTFVRDGLKSLRKPHRQGLASLIAIAELNPNKIKASHIGFVLGPRLNAAGRLDSALVAYELLTTEDKRTAGKLAQELDVRNFERREITREIQTQAEQIALADNPDVCLLFAAHPDFKPGVVGLAASRLTELYYRPAIVAHKGEIYTRASCRSIPKPEFHITRALDQCADLLVRYGGHAAAAGFTVHNDNLPTLVERLQLIAEEKLDGEDLRPTIQADAEVFLVDLEPSLLDHLDKMQPTGYGNPQAVFITRELEVKRSKAVGRDGAHLKMVVNDERFTYDAIAFNQGHWINQIPQKIDLIYAFERNDFNTRFPYQLNVRDMKPSGIPDEN